MTGAGGTAGNPPVPVTSAGSNQPLFAAGSVAAGRYEVCASYEPELAYVPVE
jgi:hypothetical protein